MKSHYYPEDYFSYTTNNIRVTISPKFDTQNSNTSNNIYTWAYKIRISNFGDTTIQILRRYWKIFDSSGIKDEVYGEGVVGQQPIIPPHETFEYTSQVSLHSSSGIMFGEYISKNTESGEEIILTIPACSLDYGIGKYNIN